MTARVKMLVLEAIARAASQEHCKRHPELVRRGNGVIDPYSSEDVENVIRGLVAVLVGEAGTVEYSVN